MFDRRTDGRLYDCKYRATCRRNLVLLKRAPCQSDVLANYWKRQYCWLRPLLGSTPVISWSVATPGEWKYSADAKYTTRVFSDASKAVCYCYVNDVLVLVLLLLLLQPMLQQHTTTTTTRNDDDNDKRRRHWTTTTTTHNCGCDSLYRTITKFFNFAVLECWRVCDCETECSFVYLFSLPAARVTKSLIQYMWVTWFLELLRHCWRKHKSYRKLHG